MRKHPIIRSIFLLYVALFINLGSSMHRAPIFGLHGKVAGSTSCGCGCHQYPQELDPEIQVIEKQTCDCSLCQYFEVFNVDIALDVPYSQSDERSNVYQKFVVRELGKAISTQARGPPLG